MRNFKDQQNEVEMSFRKKEKVDVWNLAYCPLGPFRLLLMARFLFYFMAEYFIIYKHHFFIHSSVGEHFGCYSVHILATVSNAAMNIWKYRYVVFLI